MTLDRTAVAQAAEAAGLPTASVLAVVAVESAGTAIWHIEGQGDWPPIRPEGHVFWEHLPPGLRQRAAELGLAWPKYRRGAGPRSRRGAVETYQRMADLHPEAAAAATSWGLGQVMGYHGPALGYPSARALAAAARQGPAGQVEVMLAYIRHAGLAADLARLPDRRAAERFARGYNGPAWRNNDYAAKLIAAWHAATRDPLAPADAPMPLPSPRGTAALQRRLSALGHDPGAVDGMMGARTAAALRGFQQAEGLVADGLPGPMTWAALDDAEAEAREAAAPGRRRKAAMLLTGGAVLGGDVVDPAAMIGQATQAAEAARDLADRSGLLQVLGPLGTAAALGLAIWLLWPHLERLLGGEARR